MSDSFDAPTRVATTSELTNKRSVGIPRIPKRRDARFKMKRALAPETGWGIWI